MLSDAQTTIGADPALAILPGALIFITVAAINSLGDALQASLDPRNQNRGR